MAADEADSLGRKEFFGVVCAVASFPAEAGGDGSIRHQDPPGVGHRMGSEVHAHRDWMAADEFGKVAVRGPGPWRECCAGTPEKGPVPALAVIVVAIGWP